MTFARTEEGLALRRLEMRCEALMDGAARPAAIKIAGLEVQVANYCPWCGVSLSDGYTIVAHCARKPNVVHIHGGAS